MRYLPMILGAGLLLSVGLLAGSGPAHAAMPTLRWIVPLSRTRLFRTRLATDAYAPRDDRRSYRSEIYASWVRAYASEQDLLILDGFTMASSRPYYGLLRLAVATSAQHHLHRGSDGMTSARSLSAIALAVATSARQCRPRPSSAGRPDHASPSELWRGDEVE